MSSTSSTVDDSQDDSETNFVAGYALEVQDEGNPIRNPNMPFITEEKEDCTQPYDGEPIADENWISHYNEEKIVQDERLQVLQSRLDKPETVDMWCKCGNCSVELLQHTKECQCCMEIDSCIEAINSENVLRELEHPPTCITFHPGFKPVCLEVWSLRLAGRKYRKLDKKKYQQTDSENRYLRAISYREYIQLVYGYLGRRRIPLPACAYHAIRTKFWEASNFRGYEDE